MTLHEFKLGFDRDLDAYLAKKLAAAGTELQDQLLADALKQVRAIALHGGKRLRPYLVNLTYRSFGGREPKNIAPFLLAIELFHLYCLVHDDVMDHGLLRNGQTTIHEFVADQLKQEQRLGNLVHLGLSQAILVGDLLNGWVHELVTQTQQARAGERFFTMEQAVYLGQMLDVDFTSRRAVSSEEIARKNQLKTARYTFVGPLQIGLALAEGEEQLNPALERIGLKLGMAFQERDDLLEVTEENNYTDFETSQHTFLSQYVLDNGSPAQRATFGRLFGVPLDHDSKAKLQTILTESGAITAAASSVNRELEAATELLVEVVDQTHLPEWRALIDRLLVARV